MAQQYPMTRNAHMRYAQPVRQQYESFFNPIPIEFVQEQLMQRQNRYDQAYAGALDAKDQAAQAEVGMLDVAYKNKIVEDFKNNTNKIVEERYGGDWGKASKEIARTVTNIRSNPFWNAAKEMEKQRQLAQQLKLKYGQDAVIFNDPTTMTTMDEYGRVRTPESIQPDIIQKGDWVRTAQELMGNIKPDSNPYGLSQSDIAAFLEYGDVTQISPEKIEKFANDPNIQRAFINRHQELPRIFTEGNAQMKSRFGIDEDTDIGSFVKNQLLAAGRPMESRQVRRQFIQNPMFQNKTEDEEQNNPFNYYGSSTYQPVGKINNDYEKHKDIVESRNISPSVTKYKGTSLGTGYGVSVEFGNLRKEKMEETSDIQKEKYYNELLQRYPELKGKSMEESFSIVGDYLKNAQKESNLSWTLRYDDSRENVKSNLLSNINTGNFEVKGVKSTGDVFDKKNIVKELGYNDYEEFQKVILAEDFDISPKINFDSGRLEVTVPDKKNKKPVSLSFTVDSETNNILEIGKVATQSYYDNTDLGTEDNPAIELPFLDHKSNYTNYKIIIYGDNKITGDNNKVIRLVNDRDGTKSSPMSLKKLQELLAGQIDTRFNNYQGLTGNTGKLKE